MAYPPNLVDHLWKEPRQGTFAILDGARDEEIYPALQRWKVQYRCLFAGELSPVMAKVAPYLVPIYKKSLFTNWVLEHSWGDSWGIFFQSPANLNVLRRHFRRFLKVTDEEGKNMYFRYYDPRVLRVYLPTCNEEELITIFGPVTRYITEGEDPDSLMEFRQEEAKLITESFKLEEATQPEESNPLV